jgi:hypothetical protein
MPCWSEHISLNWARGRQKNEISSTTGKIIDKNNWLTVWTEVLVELWKTHHFFLRYLRSSIKETNKKTKLEQKVLYALPKVFLYRHIRCMTIFSDTWQWPTFRTTFIQSLKHHISAYSLSTQLWWIMDWQNFKRIYLRYKEWIFTIASAELAAMTSSMPLAFVPESLNILKKNPTR